MTKTRHSNKPLTATDASDIVNFILAEPDKRESLLLAFDASPPLDVEDDDFMARASGLMFDRALAHYDKLDLDDPRALPERIYAAFALRIAAMGMLFAELAAGRPRAAIRRRVIRDKDGFIESVVDEKIER